MRKIFNTFAYAAIAALALSSCAKEKLQPADELTGKLVTVHFGTENTDPSTKATLTPNDGETAFQAAWENGDQILISYSYNYENPSTTTGSWKDKSFEAKLPAGNGVWMYDAAYPVPAENNSVDFGSNRTQNGNAYNSKYDIMIGSAVAEGAAEGKDAQGNDIIFEMDRQTAIAYFHFTSDIDEPLVSATLKVTEGAIANSAASISELFKFVAEEANDLKEINLTFEKGTAPSAKDFQLWFNVLPTPYSSMTLTVETATKTFTISKSTDGVYEAGKLYKVSKSIDGKWEDKPKVINTYILVTADQSDWSGQYIMVATNDNTDYAFDKTKTTDNSWGKTDVVTVNDGKILTESQSMVLSFVKGTTEGTYSILTNDNYYFSASAKSKFNLSDSYSSDNSDFTISIGEDNGVTIEQASSATNPKRNLRFNYNSGSGGFRWYDGATGVVAKLYKSLGSKQFLSAPANLSVVSETKQVNWDVVDGAASYIVTIGDQTYETTSNSYDASSIIDDYYYVSVVSVPSDTEKYVNSEPAVLEDAKFGTPKLPTPTLSAGVIEETSVAFSWTKDARATNGYHWALYNGETLVQEATETSKSSAEVTGLSFGTTYTAKVYAIAVEGEKPYAQSETGSLDLITKAKTTISTIVSAGTGTTQYAISDLTVMAVSGSNFVVKDETGLMFCYKSGATTGDVVTLEGTYVDYQGLKEFSPTVYTKTSTVTVDHGTATDLNSSNVAAYVDNPVVQYVKVNVPVASDGSLKLGDVAVYQYGNSLASYAGRTINLYGYTLGYNTTKSNIVLLQTSVEIDQTVPYLKVDPTSKTWESEETDAAVFNVTTNTEGEKDWSVSPTTLDWAKIDIDKTAGTITVTPNGAAETVHEAKLTVSHSARTLSKTITLTQKAASTGGETVTYTALFGSDYNSKSVQNYTSTWSATNNKFTVDIVNWNNNQNKWDFIKAGSKSAASVATITTHAAISEAISKVAITIDAVTASNINSITLYCGDSADACTTSLGTFTIATGEQSVTISSPTSNKFYKISADCKKSSNGTLTVSKVVYTNN